MSKHTLNPDALEDLYEACKLAVKWLANSTPTTDIDGPKPLPVLLEAIAKAEGRS